MGSDWWCCILHVTRYFRSVTSSFNFIREVCAEYFKQNPVVIDGPGIEVEIDESKFGRRKYNRGRWQEGHWVFGGIERTTGKSYLK